jgi:hypothetical protein
VRLPRRDLLGPSRLSSIQTKTFLGAILEGLDYELIYILDTSIFGHGDWGQFTYTVNGTWVSRFELQVNPSQNPFGINGQFVPTGFCPDQFAPS